MRPLPAASGQASHPARAHAVAADQPVLGDLPGAWLAAVRRDGADVYEYVLLLRFALINAVALALPSVIWLQGWIDVVLAGDTTRLVLIIAAVFATGLALCGRKIWQISTELNQVKQPKRRRPSRVAGYLESIEGRPGDRGVGAAPEACRADRADPSHREQPRVPGADRHGDRLHHRAFGRGCENASDVHAVGTMVSTLISGMSVALYTTLVGAVLNIWLMVNYRLLESGTVRLITAIVELGERHVRS